MPSEEGRTHGPRSGAQHPIAGARGASVEALKTKRERLWQEHAAGASGLWVVRALSDAVDEAVLGTWSNAGLDAEWALVATGGYGRGELSPHSDIDLLLLHRKPERLAEAARALAYSFWDGGLSLSHQVMSPKESLRLARDRTDVFGAYLDARLLAGDAVMFEEWKVQVTKKHPPGSEAFRKLVGDAAHAWRRQGGDAGADLEPNLKDGRGGLRDVAALRWFGVLAKDDPFLESAAELLHRTRNQLHFSTERRTDMLSMQHQDEVAVALSLSPPSWGPEPLPPEDELLRNLYAGCRYVSALLDEILFPDPEIQNVVARLARVTSVRTSGDAGLRESFLDLLKRLAGRPDALFTPRFSLLDVLPEWAGVYCLPQRNVYHRHAVDYHSAEVVAVAVALSDDPDDLTRRVAEDARADLDSLLLACLFHDIGKGSQEDHSQRGERIAGAALERMGMPSGQADDVVWLVANHLLLAETATRRDIGDESLIIELAERVGSERRLRMLYLLTVADARATSPSAWTPWKATLVARLFTRINHVLERGELVGVGVTETAREQADLLRGALTEPKDEVEDHITNMPRAWLLAQTPEGLVRQSEVMFPAPGPDEVRLVAHPETESGVWEVLVSARDRPGLFSKVSGSLALHGLNVLAAEIYTRADGVALEVFRVEALGHEEHRFERVAEDARLALLGRLALDARLAEKQRDYAGRFGKGKKEAPQVVVDNRVSDFYTVIEVHATDRIGLLFTITRALADMELDIHLAKVSTYAEDVVDVFYVRDLDGQKVEDEKYLDEIRRTILHRLT